MTVQSLPGGVFLPRPPAIVTGGPSFSSTIVLDAADEGLGMMITAPKTGNIHKVHFATRTVTTGATVDVRIETVTASAVPATPSGTLWGTNTNGSQVIANADDNVWFATALTADAAVTQGDPLAIVIKNPNSSFGNLQLSGFVDDAIVSGNFPYNLLNTGVSPSVSWAGHATAPVMALEYDDGSIVPIIGAWPALTTTATTMGTGSTPDSWGVHFQLPFPAIINGCWFWADTDGDWAARLVSTAYNQGAGTGILASVSRDGDMRYSNTSGIIFARFTAPYTITANTWYRLLIEPTTATTIALHDLSVNTLALLDAYAGQNFHLTTAKDPTQDADWTNYNSGTFRAPFIGLLLAGFDDGASTGGMIQSRVFNQM